MSRIAENSAIVDISDGAVEPVVTSSGTGLAATRELPVGAPLLMLDRSLLLNEDQLMALSPIGPVIARMREENVGAWVRWHVGAWVRGCVGAWVRGCVGAWVRGCVCA